VCALVASSGSVEWVCLPRMDGPSIFATSWTGQGGWFRLRPADVSVTADGRYLPGTMVLETAWDTPTGWAVLPYVLLVGPWRDESPASGVHRRAPSDHQGLWRHTTNGYGQAEVAPGEGSRSSVWPPT
jgi:alpha,alpha-trehalase